MSRGRQSPEQKAANIAILSERCVDHHIECLTTEWPGVTGNVELRCELCGHCWTSQVQYLRSKGYSCPGCSRLIKQKGELGMLELCCRARGITVLSTSCGGPNTKCSVRCDRCQHIWRVSPAEARGNGVWCPKWQKHELETTSSAP